MRKTEGSVHVWRADLAADGDRLEGLLCPEEIARADQIVPRRRRAMWIRSRGVLRMLLARYVGADPRELRFVLGPHGKPALHRETPGEATDLRFNLSHSGNLALLAVSTGREVGVDIERARGRHTAELLRAWVAREATGKCLGTGLTTPPESSQPDDLWSAQLDVGPQAAAAVAVEGGPCELRCRAWRS